jgi:hypothetical protein
MHGQCRRQLRSPHLCLCRSTIRSARCRTCWQRRIIGYVSRGLYARFYQDTVANICSWLGSQAAERADGDNHPRLQRIDGVTYDFKRFVDAEADLQLAALLPEQKVLMAFDLVFSPNQHAFTGASHFDHWTIVLESLKALQGYDTIIIGHDTLVDRAAIDSTITYVKRAKQIHAAAADAKGKRTFQRSPFSAPREL